MPSFFHLRQHLSLSHQQHVWLCTETCNLVWLVTSYPVAAAEQQGGRFVTFALQRLTTWQIGAQQRKRRRCAHRHLRVQLQRKRPALHLQALLAVRACSPLCHNQWLHKRARIVSAQAASLTSHGAARTAAAAFRSVRSSRTPPCWVCHFGRKK